MPRHSPRPLEAVRQPVFCAALERYMRWNHSVSNVHADIVIAKADPKDPNADLNTILGITDEK